MEKKQKSDHPVQQMVLRDEDMFWGRKIPQAFWDEWLKCFTADAPEPSLSEELTVLQERTAQLPESQQKELAIVIRNAVSGWTQEKLRWLIAIQRKPLK